MPLVPSSAKAILPPFCLVVTIRTGSGQARCGVAGTVPSTATNGPTIIATR